MTEEEIRSAVLAALLDYETFKKDRRLKAVKKTLRGTVMATVIGSSGLMAANQDKAIQQHVIKAVAAVSAKSASAPQQAAKAASQQQTVSGVAHFGLARYKLSSNHADRLFALTKQLPSDAELIVIGRADSVGGYAYNKKLAKKRAQGVAAYLSQNGLKIKAVVGKVSEYQPDSWMLRRVDVVVNHSSLQPVAIALPPILDLYDARNKVAQSAAVAPVPATKPGIPFVDDGIEGSSASLMATGKKRRMQIVPNSGESEAAASQVKKASASRSIHAGSKQQSVRGVAHFALNHVEITSAHKDRLDSLFKQLPKNAELIVIGRNDAAREHKLNEKLGKLRARAVANYLAGKGANIVGVATKAANQKSHGWSARRVDILVKHSANDVLQINLPPLNNHHAQGNEQRLRVVRMPFTSARHKKAHLMMHRLIQAMKKMDATKKVPPEGSDDSWWDETKKVNNSRLNKTSWSEKTGRDANKL